MIVMDQDWMLWRKRRTVGWLNLSLAARGAAEGIATQLDDRGELRLGKPGLPGLAALLGRPWTEVEPAVLELLEAGRYVLDAERGVLLDPQHAERREAADAAHGTAIAAMGRPWPAAAAMAATAARRPLSMTTNAIRKRAKRQAKLAALRDQLELPAMAAVAATAAAPTTTISSSDQEKGARPRPPRRPAAPTFLLELGMLMPAAACVIATTVRPDLSHDDVARAWSKFVENNHGTDFDPNWWRGFIRKEDPTKDLGARPRPRPAVLAEAAMAPPRPPVARPAWCRAPELEGIFDGAAQAALRRAEAVPRAEVA